MKKFILVLNAINVMERLLCSKRVKGVLYIDQDTGKLTFKAFSGQTRIHQKDVLLKKLPWGWVKESVGRIKVHSSFPKEMGSATMLGLLDEQNRDAKNALIDREIFEFC